MTNLQGKIAVVTGASAGIGFAIAQRLIADGAHVYITGRNARELEGAREALGAGATAVAGDASNLDDLDRLFSAVRAGHGKLDIVVVNAGAMEQLALEAATPAHFDKLFGLNVRGTFFTAQKALPLLVDGGAIVLVASATHGKGLPGLGAYSASKAAVRSFARTWAAELKARGIRVNSLSPGGVDTPLLTGEHTPADEVARLRALYETWIPLGRIGRTAEIAEAARFLASSDSSYCTGMDLVADGGFTQL